MGKNSLNNFICHLSWLGKLSPTHTHPLISICEFLKPYELLFCEFEFWPTPPPPLHDPPHPYMTHPTPPHPFMTHPTPPLYDTPTPPLHDPPYPTPPLHDPPTPPHPTLSWPTPPLHDPPHPHPTPSWPTHPTPPHPWYIFGHKGAFFHGLLHYVSLSVDNNCGPSLQNDKVMGTSLINYFWENKWRRNEI